MCLVTVMTAVADDTQVRIFDPNVKSLKIAPLSNMYLPPIYVLGSDDVLNVNFDYLDLDIQYLRYSVTHCNANWQPSQLVESEYIDGFNQADVTDYKPSEATFVHYFNYDFCIPNNDFIITKSGNYVLKVYRQDDPDAVLFQTRFSVCENTMGVYGEVLTNTDVDYNAHHQQVNFVVTTKGGERISDPYNELGVIVTQNSRPDNEVMVTKPLMVSGNKVTFEHNRDLIFPAGNEYRRIEMVNVNSMNMGVEKIQYFEPYYHATLYRNEPRVDGQYLYDKTQHGHFTIRTSGLTTRWWKATTLSRISRSTPASGSKAVTSLCRAVSRWACRQSNASCAMTPTMAPTTATSCSSREPITISSCGCPTAVEWGRPA